MLGDRIPTSDPIEAFSSPNNAKYRISEHGVSPRRLSHQSAALSNKEQENLDQNDFDDSDLPETPNMFKQNIEDSRKKQALKEVKARALACLQPAAVGSSDGEDDDLEIVAFSSAKTTVKEESVQRKSGNKLQISEGRKRQMQFGKVSLRMQEKEQTFTLSPARGGFTKLADQTTLNRIIAVEARKEAQRVTRKKEEEWQKHGGRVSINAAGQGQGLANVCKTIAEKGLKAAEERETVDSESEDENENACENVHSGALAIPGEVEGYRRSTSSCELPTEDEYDKENNVSLMYDRSEDKENNAVVRHSTSIFDIRCDSPSLPDFTPSSLLNDKATRGDEANTDRRRPLGELLSEESPIASPIGHSDLTQSFTAKLQQASPSSNTLTPFLPRERLQPAFDSFSQFSEGEEPAVLLQPGFADLFESGTERQKSPKQLDVKLSGDVCPSFFNFFSPQPNINLLFFKHLSGAEDLRTLRRTNTLNLTQDVTLVFQAENKLLMRKADAIFEKEQAFVLEAATRKIHDSKPDLYVNELG